MVHADSSERVIDVTDRRSRGRWLVLLAALSMVVVAAWYGYQHGRGDDDVADQMADMLVEPQPEPVVTRTAEVEPETPVSTAAAVEPAPEPPSLPALPESDPLVRSSLVEILGESRAASLLPEDDILRRQVALLNGLSGGTVLRKPITLPAPQGKFVATRSGDRVVLGEENFARYEALVALAESLDPATLAAWFERFEPLFDTAWTELGRPKVSARQALRASLEVILATPDIDGELDLVQPSVFYRYADPALEKLPDVQKLLLRMGPDNRRRIKQRCRALLEALNQR